MSMFTDEQIKQLAAVIDERLDEKLDQKLQPIKEQLDKQGKDIKQIKNDVSVLVKSTNRDDMRLQKRVKRVEDHLNLPPLEDTPGVTAH